MNRLFTELQLISHEPHPACMFIPKEDKLCIRLSGKCDFARCRCGDPLYFLKGHLKAAFTGFDGSMARAEYALCVDTGDFEWTIHVYSKKYADILLANMQAQVEKYQAAKSAQ